MTDTPFLSAHRKGGVGGQVILARAVACLLIPFKDLGNL